jgi:hypothetical protein
MVWCNGFSNGLVCLSGKCSGMESGDGRRESLWETLTGVEQSLRTSTGDVPLLVRFWTDNMFVPWDYSVQQLESSITSSSALAPPVYSSGMNHVAGDKLNKVVSARELLSCIQSAVSENRTVHSALSKHNLWLQDAARNWICASVPALVMSYRIRGLWANTESGILSLAQREQVNTSSPRENSTQKFKLQKI